MTYLIKILMPNIITNSQFQRNPKNISEQLHQKGCIVTKHGVPEMIVLPYFDQSDELMEEYYERFEMNQNQVALQNELKASKVSGDSDLVL